MSGKQAKSLGDEVWKTRVEKVSGELLALTYGALVAHLLREATTTGTAIHEVNQKLDAMGHRIGTKLVEEFLAKTSPLTKCPSFRETIDLVAKVGFRMFLGVSASVIDWDAEGTTCSLQLDENPLVEFLELPDSMSRARHPSDDGATRDVLDCSSLLCGVVRGALEMVHRTVDTDCVQCVTRGDRHTVIRVKLGQPQARERPPIDYRGRD